ncbi:MAG: hypothetical protein KF725_00530 [Cyclobacteriaceae bacterium]|nr:hypothetical protein [Cyclobacteriaceae bacterium]UYN87050.1 MAG: hypothetical protein KIT51_01875 [Cyclobacteriaceae bacterium]
MIKTFTQDDLIRYLYHETTEKETQEISKALLTDPELQAMYTSMSALKKEMDAAKLEPSAQTVLNILSYSRSTSAVKH